MSNAGVVLRALGLGVAWAASTWFTAGWGYEPTPSTAPAAVAAATRPAPASYAPDAVEVTVTNTGGQAARQVTAAAHFDGRWTLVIRGGAWIEGPTPGDDTVVTWPVGDLDPGDTRTVTLAAVPAAGGRSGPITLTVEHR